MRSARILAGLVALGTLALGVRAALADTFTNVDYYTTGSFSGGTGAAGGLTYPFTATSASVSDNNGGFEVTYDFSGSSSSPTSVMLDNNGTPKALAFGDFDVTGTNTADFVSNVAFTLDIYQVLPGVVGSGTLAATVSGEIMPPKDLLVTFDSTSTISNSVPPIEYTVNNIDVLPTQSLSGTHDLVAAANVLSFGAPNSVPLPSAGLTFLAMFGAVVSLKVIRPRVAA